MRTTLSLLLAAVPIAIAASLPSTAPGWLFWGCVALSCAGAARWAWVAEREPGNDGSQAS